ncbi:mediator of RNA polymerase II transcription subunit 21 [Ampelomyces quisqualis]|uniref:Mediator of RNA polymerase II transcription subunit 21 n=1 Tax=Ampelomyces quisqualis TaxID=50730 RepID=A0A6A5QDK5_AMPQU|nr:mediator of RNA polymerase II transcription subunit 21 [Ampelomyces quisqualis]
MSDILTQIQDEMDFLLNMMQRQMAHIRVHAPPSVPPGQQRVDTFSEIQAKTATENTHAPTAGSQLTQAPAPPAQPEPISPEQFRDDIKEFARDIVIKQQQMEALIAHLPGLNVSEHQQLERMKQLERELEDLEAERLDAVKEKELLLRRVEDKIMNVGRVR